MSTDSDGCGGDIDGDEEGMNGLVREGGGEDWASPESCGVRPGGRAGEGASGSSLSIVISSVVDWLAEESTAGADDAAVDSGT